LKVALQLALHFSCNTTESCFLLQSRITIFLPAISLRQNSAIMPPTTPPRSYKNPYKPQPAPASPIILSTPPVSLPLQPKPVFPKSRKRKTALAKKAKPPKTPKPRARKEKKSQKFLQELQKTREVPAAGTQEAGSSKRNKRKKETAQEYKDIHLPLSKRGSLNSLTHLSLQGVSR
jgi:hypothetical protein